MTLHKSIFFSILVFWLASCSALDSQDPVVASLSAEQALESYADQVVFQSQFSFEGEEDTSLWGMNKADVQEGLVQLEGDQQWGSYLVYLDENGPGSGAVARFRFSQNAVFLIVMQHGEWATPQFREIGFGLIDNQLQSALTIGNSPWQTADPERSIAMLPDTWYQSAFFVEDSGAFVIKLWPEEDPDNAGLFTFMLAEEDRDLGWRLAVQVHSKNVDVDTVSIYHFSSLQATAFPELAALQPITTPQPTLIPTVTPIPSPTPLPTQGAGTTSVNTADGSKLMYIPAGEFVMGFDEERAVEFHDKLMDPIDLIEYPNYYAQLLPHVVYTDAFWMYQSEVTNQQYAAFLNEKGNQEQAPYNFPNRGSTWYAGLVLSEIDGVWGVNDDREDHPVVRVDWYGARAYCEWAGGRLPTEAEWEKAARGGLDAKMFPWGDEQPVDDASGQAANGVNSSFGRDTLAGTDPVGSYAPNGFGLYNMAGNVFELTADWYAQDAYLNSELENPQGPTYAEREVQFGLFDRRVIRGGSWYHDVYFQTVWYRSGSYPFSRQDWLGFRCAVDLE